MRAALLPTTGDPFVVAYWLRNYATWRDEVDELVVLVNSSRSDADGNAYVREQVEAAGGRVIFLDIALGHGRRHQASSPRDGGRVRRALRGGRLRPPSARGGTCIQSHRDGRDGRHRLATGRGTQHRDVGPLQPGRPGRGGAQPVARLPVRPQGRPPRHERSSSATRDGTSATRSPASGRSPRSTAASSAWRLTASTSTRSRARRSNCGPLASRWNSSTTSGCTTSQHPAAG